MQNLEFEIMKDSYSFGFRAIVGFSPKMQKIDVDVRL